MLDLTWDQLWEITTVVEDQRAELADMLLRPHMKPKWKGYADARRSARAKARRMEEAKTNPKVAAEQDARLLAFFGMARVPVPPRPSGSSSGEGEGGKG